MDALDGNLRNFELKECRYIILEAERFQVEYIAQVGEAMEQNLFLSDSTIISSPPRAFSFIIKFCQNKGHW